MYAVHPWKDEKEWNKKKEGIVKAVCCQLGRKSRLWSLFWLPAGRKREEILKASRLSATGERHLIAALADLGSFQSGEPDGGSSPLWILYPIPPPPICAVET